MSDMNYTTSQDYNDKCVINVERMSKRNSNFRTVIWTGCYSQMTLMCIPVCSDIGLENHRDADQIIRIEQGIGMVKMGFCKDNLDYQMKVGVGDVVFVPAGTWHNITNIGNIPMKVSSVYAPPHHPAGAIDRTKN